MYPRTQSYFQLILTFPILDTLPPEAFIGPVDPDTVPSLAVEPTAEEKCIAATRAALPHPGAAINLDDIEALAYQVLTARVWAYYSSAGDDEQSISLFFSCLQIDAIHAQQIKQCRLQASLVQTTGVNILFISTNLY